MPYAALVTDVVGAGGFEPPNTGFKVPRLNRLATPHQVQAHAPPHWVQGHFARVPLIRIAGPCSARTAQHAHDPRTTRVRIWRACSNERATPKTVGPLPDIAAPSAPAASSAACIRPISGWSGA